MGFRSSGREHNAAWLMQGASCDKVATLDARLDWKRGEVEGRLWIARTTHKDLQRTGRGQGFEV